MSTQATSDIARDADADGFPVRFELLGPFRVLHHDQPIKVGGPTAQAVLIALIQNRNDTVPLQQIVSVWGREKTVEPDSVYHYVSDLRKALKTTGLTIADVRPGYRIDVPNDAVDAVRFDGLVRGARALRDTDPEEAIARLRQALDLWHGPNALPGIRLAGIRRLAAGLDARRLDAEEDLAVLELDRGHADQVLDRLRDLVSRHPGRAGLFAALIRALHATGRTDEAEHRCAQAERTAQARGKSLHPKVARAATDLHAKGQPAPASRPSIVPFQLPRDISDFTGRADDLTHLLDQWPADDGSAPGTLVVSAVEGMAGIGKTALAVHAAHQLADRFGDGVLSIDLRGFTPDAEPTPPEQALDILLRGLGVPGQNIPPDLDARVALYRTVLARRRVLILLDNAADEDQIRPLLPSSAGCLVLVTSRRKLAGLDDADHVILGVLPEPDAMALFYKVAGDRATSADQQVVADIVRLCGHLPLAVRIAASRLRISTAMTATHLHTELDAELKTSKSLDGLDDGSRSVAAVLAVSYRHLTAEQQAAFRLIGLHPGTNLEPHALAALLDSTVQHALRLVDDLHAVSLTDQPTHHRHTLHGLIRAHAATLATTDPEPDRRAALTRLFGHYANTATLAMAVVYPFEADQRPRRPDTPQTRGPDLNTTEVAEAWLDAELDNLLASAAHAASHGRHEDTTYLSSTLRRHLRTRARYTDAATLHTLALTAARSTGNPAGELDALTGLGYIHWRQGRYEQATNHFEQALAIARDTGDRVGELNALDGLGRLHFMQGRHERATEHFEHALGIARDTGNHVGELDALTGLGHIRWRQGRYEQATNHFEQALAIARDTGYRSGELNALNGLGHLHRAEGRHERAAACYDRALGIARHPSDRISELTSLNCLGDVRWRQGRHQQATYYFGQVLGIACDSGDRNYQFEAHQGMGRTHHATGHHETALTCHRTALELATDLDQPPDQARAHDGLACAHLALDHHDHARQHWQTALNIVTTHRIDHTDEPQVTTETLRSHLAELDRQQSGAE